VRACLAVDVMAARPVAPALVKIDTAARGRGGGTGFAATRATLPPARDQDVVTKT